MAVKYMGKNSDRGPSPKVWARIDTAKIQADPNYGMYFFDDFLKFGSLTAGDATADYYSAVDSGGTILQLATEVSGVIQFLTDGTQYDGIVMNTGHNRAGMLKITENSNQKACFEARVRFSEAVTDQGFFVGMTEEGIAVANTILVDATGAVVAKDYVGYRVLAADPDGIDAVYNTESGTEVVVADAAQDIVIATWYKLGWYFDGKTTVYFYVDGVEVGSAETDATYFPDGEELAPLIAFKGINGTAEYVDMDWWGCAYESAP